MSSSTSLAAEYTTNTRSCSTSIYNQEHSESNANFNLAYYYSPSLNASNVNNSNLNAMTGSDFSNETNLNEHLVLIDEFEASGDNSKLASIDNSLLLEIKVSFE